jgi:hypothetical protein
MRVRLTVDTVSLVWDGERRRVSMIPKGAVVHVTGYAPQRDGMINVVWNSQEVMMFAVDVNQRGEHEIG